jgi:hypothetical protein
MILSLYHFDPDIQAINCIVFLSVPPCKVR